MKVRVTLALKIFFQALAKYCEKTQRRSVLLTCCRGRLVVSGDRLLGFQDVSIYLRKTREFLSCRLTSPLFF